MEYRNISNAISFAIQEVRHTRYELNNNEEFTDIKTFEMLTKVEEKLEEAINNLW